MPKIPNKNQITLPPNTVEYKKGKPKLKVRKIKTVSGDIPQEVIEFIQEFIFDNNLSPQVNVALNGNVFPYYFEEEKIVLDYLREETPDELERLKVNRDLCKRYGLTRIPISKHKYKNQLTKILEV